MGKSVNDYYSEKMKKLLEMQNSRQETQLLASPAQSNNAKTATPKGQASAGDGKGYYEQFRSKVEKERHDRYRQDAKNAAKAKTQSRPSADRPSDKTERIRINPEQTAKDRYEENVRYEEAMQTAKKARVKRRLRDGLISIGLIFALLIAVGVVVYRLLFVINDLSFQGSTSYSSEELLLASGVMEGDHLYSFSSKEKGELISLRCPMISEVDVERTPPGKIVFNVTEETGVFYADFYGEYRTMSETLRILDPVSAKDAKDAGYIKLKLPDIVSATAGKVPEYASVRNDEYVFNVCEAVLESALAQRVGNVDLSDKYDITMSVDGKYKIKFGDSESIEIKLRIAAAVLNDEMFEKDIMATIDVSDLSQTSVVVDDGIDLE